MPNFIRQCKRLINGASASNLKRMTQTVLSLPHDGAEHALKIRIELKLRALRFEENTAKPTASDKPTAADVPAVPECFCELSRLQGDIALSRWGISRSLGGDIALSWGISEPLLGISGGYRRVIEE